jgi:hypothetical protein
MDKIFRVGTINLFTCDETDKELDLKKIKHPMNVRDVISDMVEKERERLNIRGREMYGVADAGMPDDNNNDN